LTGKLPSDLNAGGVGSYTTSRDAVSKKEQPWADDVIFSKRKDWDVYYRNATYVYYLLYGDERIKQLSAYPGGVEAEKASGWDGIHHIMLGSSEETKRFYQREKQFISDAQSSDGSQKNEMYFVLYHQVHSAISASRNIGAACDRIEELLSCWDFSEPDSLFIVFSDHGDFRRINEWSTTRDSWLTWAMIKDNSNYNATSRIKKSMISISDLHDLISEKMGLNTTGILLQPQDKERIYFMEDARTHIDKFKSTTASAIKVTAWNEDSPIECVQVIYYKPERRFRMLHHNLCNSSISEYNFVDDKIMSALVNRFDWISG